LFAAGVQLFDVQFATAHLTTLGAYVVPRAEYLRRLAVVGTCPLDLRRLLPTLGPVAPIGSADVD
jgi:Leu/Phe-tRNA-protein transferase